MEENTPTPQDTQSITPAEESTQETVSSKISIDEFKKVEMTVGEIKSAEKVENADKLLRLTVDVGEPELRQIVSGISVYFPDPQVLVGKKVPFVTNLAPRVIRGLTSNGMILAARDSEDHFSLLEVEPLIASGTKLS
jgi:methionyl-tRNA synthetase